MKIRVAFVSNSSSSSFIVAFPKGFVASPAAVRAYLFGKRASFANYEGGKPLSAERASELIYAQMRVVRPNNQKLLLQALGGGLPGEPSETAFGLDLSKPMKLDAKAFNLAWKAWGQAVDQFRRDYLVRHQPTLPGGADLYAFIFWDNNADGGAGATLMYNYGFRGVPHWQRGRNGVARTSSRRA